MKKTVFNILLLAFITIGCNESKQSEKDNFESNKSKKSDFNLKKDFADFKIRMTEMDTINVFVDHSVCTYQGYEHLLITKKSDSIKVRSQFKDYDRQNADWELVFEKMLPKNDTIWDFGSFLNRNVNRLTADVEEHAKIIVKNGGQQMRFVTDGLVDLNRFKADYDSTMRKLYEPTDQFIYGVPIPTETEIEDEKLNGG